MTQDQDQIAYEIPDPTTEVIEITDDNGQGGDPDIVIMSTGIQFRVKGVSKHAIGGITERYTKNKPQPPYNYVKAKGRKEANPEHPDYQDALTMWNVSMAMALNNFLMLRGTVLDEESIPDDMVHFESEEWADEMEIIGSNPGNKRACYLDWLKMVACPEDDIIRDSQIVHMGDIGKMLHAIGRKSGIAQEDVNEAVEKFRR